MIEALQFQRNAVGHTSLSSPLYAALLDCALTDVEAGGPCADVLAQVPDGVRPIPDALALRFLGALHRLVLDGSAPALAQWFPSAGGEFHPGVDDPSADFLAAVDDHRDALVAGLGRGVQTNEVGRCATLAVGFLALLREFDLPLRLLELGASAGLNLRWNRWRYEADERAWGDRFARLTFADCYSEPWIDLDSPRRWQDAVAERHGCDRAPIDPTTDDGRLALKSFVWPDQGDRHARLDAALVVAQEVPAVVDAADAGEWVTARLAEPAPGTCTVVYHSIVWQYLPRDSRSAVKTAVTTAGAAATSAAPIAWLRMEPGDVPSDAAELRLRVWPGGEDRLLAHSGYHGWPVWLAGDR